MINRIRNYDYINRELRSQNELQIPIGEQAQPPEAPPIIQHKDNISQLTIYNTGWSEGYTAGYQDGTSSQPLWNYQVLAILAVICVSLGLSIGIWL